MKMEIGWLMILILFSTSYGMPSRAQYVIPFEVIRLATMPLVARSQVSLAPNARKVQASESSTIEVTKPESKYQKVPLVPTARNSFNTWRDLDLTILVALEEEKERASNVTGRMDVNDDNDENQSQRDKRDSLTIFRFKAYDCSLPKDVTTVIRPDSDKCHYEPIISRQTNGSFLVLQLSQQHRFPAFRCTWTETRMPFYCGATDHQTYAGMISQHDQEQEVPEEVCRYWVEKGEYRDNLPIKIAMNSTVWSVMQYANG